VKLHGVPVTTFSEDGLSAIGTNIGTPLMLDSYTSDMWDPRYGMRSLVVLVLPLLLKKIDKMERLIIKGTDTLVDDEGIPLTRIDSLGNHDSDDEVASVDNDMANFLASKDVGYGTNSLLEQWKESYEDEEYDYDPYDDDMYEGQDIPDKIQDICDNLYIKVQGRKKK
ncbi:hypothetical protein Tco_1063740, partial [Tanacetum coccineum]